MSYFLTNNRLIFVIVLCDGDPILLKQIFVRHSMQRDLKTIAPLSHRPIVLTDTIDYRTIGFLHYRFNPKKGKKAYLYSAFYILCISQSAQARITQFYLLIHHACLSFVSVHQMAPPMKFSCCV